MHQGSDICINGGLEMLESFYVNALKSLLNWQSYTSCVSCYLKWKKKGRYFDGFLCFK